MIKLFFLSIVLCFAAFGQGLKGLQYTGQDVKIPLGATCYTMQSQMLLDNALDRGIKCEGNLKLCRKWRDRYRSQLNAKCPGAGLPKKEKSFVGNTNKKWPDFLMIGLSGFFLGLATGAAF